MKKNGKCKGPEAVGKVLIRDSGEASLTYRTLALITK
jgi:hypothetical protein